MQQSPATLLPKTLAAFFWHFIKQQRSGFILIQVLALAWALDNTLWPYAIKLIIDKITLFSGDKADMWHFLAPVLIFWLVLWLVIEIMYRVQGFIAASIIPSFEANIRMQMFDYVQQHSYRYFSDHFAGNLSNKISDITQGASRIMMLWMTLFVPAFIALLIASSLFFFVSPYFALILCGWVVIHMGICLFAAKKCSRLSETHAESRSFLTGKIVDTFTNIINVKLFARGRFESSRMWDYQRDERVKQQVTWRYMEKIRVVLGIASLVLPGILLTWLMLYSWQQGLITVGDVVLVFMMTGNIMTLAWISGTELPNLFKEIGSCQQALSLIKPPHEIMDVSGAKPLQVTSGEIQFDKVSFHYHPDKPIFMNKSVHIYPGEKLGLVGFSGSGKTTFVNLMMRFFDIQGGRILIDGQDVSQVTKDSLRANIAMIEQHPTLFHRSLWDNIQYGRLDATPEEVMAASHKAHCHEFIVQLPDSYDAMVGERGIKLSGGQRQRIALARALLKQAPILILDEATSALDSVTEQTIQSNLKTLMHQRTTIVIAHRLSTLANMDRILVFDQGEMIESGSHTGLLATGGHYAKMWQMQAGGFLPASPTVTGDIS